MAPEIVGATGAIVATLVGLIPAIRSHFGIDRRRQRIRHDLELLEKVPTNMSDSREELELVIGADIRRLAAGELV